MKIGCRWHENPMDLKRASIWPTFESRANRLKAAARPSTTATKFAQVGTKSSANRREENRLQIADANCRKVATKVVINRRRKQSLKQKPIC